MRNLLLIVITLLTGAVQTYAAAGHNDIWQKGNTCFQQKQYDSAAYYYEQLAALKPQNAEIYYNLGNTYYRLNKIAPAVLNYERALKINPEYKEAKENLILAQERISNHIPGSGTIFFIRWWKALTQAGLATTWSVCALVAFVIFIALLFMGRYSKIYKGRIPVQLPAIVIFIFCILLLFSIVSTQKSQQHESAVVMENDTPLMNNDLKGKPLMLIPEGTTVTINDERAGWLEVRLPDGRTGWVRQEQISKI